MPVCRFTQGNTFNIPHECLGVSLLVCESQLRHYTCSWSACNSRQKVWGGFELWLPPVFFHKVLSPVTVVRANQGKQAIDYLSQPEADTPRQEETLRDVRAGLNHSLVS